MSVSSFAAALMRRRFPAIAALALTAVVAGACGSSRDKGPRLTCPAVLLERSTADLVAFRAGPGRDLTDVLYEAQVTGYTGDCERGKGETTIKVTLQPTFTINRGPAWPGGQGEITYFVAVPAYYPNPAGKQVFSIPFAFPSGTMTAVVLRDEKVTLEIPMPDAAARPPAIYVGFQLTPEQLEYNRTSGR